MRCLCESRPPPAALASIGRPVRDYATEKLVERRNVCNFRRMYAYDKTALDMKAESVDESNENWRKREGELPRGLWRGANTGVFILAQEREASLSNRVVGAGQDNAWFLRNSETGVVTNYFNFLRTGRAVLCPVYQGPYERHRKDGISGPNVSRDETIQFAKDVSRSVDFLESSSGSRVAGSPITD